MTFENHKSKLMSTFNSFSGHGVEKIFSPPRYVGSRTKVVRKTLHIRGDPLPLSAIELLSSLSLVSKNKGLVTHFTFNDTLHIHL